MAEPTSDPVFQAAFLVNQRFTADLMRADLAALSWEKPNALTSAARTVRKRAKVVVSELSAASERLGAPFLRVLRNVIARADKSQVPLLSLLLDSPLPCKSAELQGIREQMPRLPAQLSLIRTLLRKKPSPTFGEFLSFFPEGPASAVLPAIFFSEDVTPSNLQSVLNALARAPEAAACGLVRDSYAPLARQWVTHGLPRITREQFEGLPQAIRVGILAFELPRTRILDASFLAELKQDKCAHPDSRMSRARQIALPRCLVHLQERDFSAPRVHKLLMDSEFLIRNRNEVIQSLFRSYSGRFKAPANVCLSAMRQLPDEELRSILLYYATPIDRRPSLLAGMTDGERQVVLGKVPKEEWIHTLAHCSTAQRKQIGKDLADLGGRKIVTPDFLTARPTTVQSSSPAARVADFVKQILSGAKAEKLPASPEVISALFEVLARPDRDLGRCVPRATLIRSLTERLDCPLDQAAKVRLTKLARRFDHPGTTTLRNTLLTCVAAKERPFAMSLLAHLKQKSAVEVLENRVLGAMTKGDSDLVVNVPGARRVADWIVLLRRYRARKAKVDPELSSAIVRAGNEAISAAVSAYPEAFSSIAAANLQLREALPLALRLPRLAAAIEERYTRDELKTHAAWIRSRWAAWPDLAAAYEIAVAASLRDGHYLRTLVRGSRGTPGRRFDHLYRTYELPKKSGGNRVITAPEPPLRRLQRRLLDGIFGPIALHPAAKGFRTGVSIADNAALHVSQPLVVNVDIRSFFPNTPHALILSACSKFTNDFLSDGACRLLADLCSYGGALPTGAPTSPTLANIILRPVDKALSFVCEKANVRYTRYADDLTFSGEKPQSVLPFVRRVLGQLGYSLDPKKTNLFRRGRRQIVTGLVVNDKPNLPRKLRRRLRAAVHARCKGHTPEWRGRPVSDSQLFGHIAMLKLVQPDEAGRLSRLLKGAPPLSDKATV